MVRKRFDKILNDINEYFSTVWVLLSDTTIFLSNNTKIFHHYEPVLRELRHKLELNRNDPEVLRQVRQDVADLRKTLRLQGYNLKLGSLDLKLEGFRNDDALARGFRRCVLYIMVDKEVLYMTGDSNHIDLAAALDARMQTEGYRPIYEKHYLWYKWVNRVLKLSGSATETPENFDLLKEYVAENKEHLLKKIRKL